MTYVIQYGTAKVDAKKKIKPINYSTKHTNLQTYLICPLNMLTNLETQLISSKTRQEMQPAWR